MFGEEAKTSYSTDSPSSSSATTITVFRLATALVSTSICITLVAKD